jgi:hypothetical protein
VPSDDISSFLTVSPILKTHGHVQTSHVYSGIPTTRDISSTSVLPVTHGSGRNRWLYDTGASEHIANDLSQFNSYKERGDVKIMQTANGPVRPLGIGTVRLDCPKSNDKSTKLILYDVVYMPQSPVNLLSGQKLMALGGYARNGMILSKLDKELCQLDSDLFVIETPRYLAFVLPAAIKKAPVDIELWHRRLGHLGLDTVRAT